MHKILLIESAERGLLMVNGQFCGPTETGGQAFPAEENAEVYIQLFPFARDIAPLAVEMKLTGGQIERLSPENAAYALLWPDGIIQLELRPTDKENAPENETASGVLLRYLLLRRAGDPEAKYLLMQPEREPELPAYDTVVPLRFAPVAAGERFDDRAGLVVRLAGNVARIDTALAMTTPAGHGKRLIERIEIMKN